MTDQQTAAPGPLRGWVDELGYVRADGWFGGVAAAIARRIGVDPLILRGAFVVTTLLGFPSLWVYAFAWALLPDEDARSTFRRGRSAVGVVVTFALAAAVSVGQLFVLFLIGASVWGGYGMPGIVFPTFVWGAFVFAAIVGLVWLARRPGAGEQSARDGFGDRATPTGSAGGTGSAVPGPPPPDGADDMATWRAQYAAWREQHNAWRVQQGEDPVVVERELRRQQQDAFRAESARIRAERRAANPRTPLAFIGVAIGAALLAGGATGGVVIGGYGVETAVTAGTLAGAAALAIAMVVAGLLRRRSGFLAFVTVIALLIGGSGVGRAALDDFVLPGAVRYPGDAPLTIYQPFGFLHLDVGPWEGGDGTTTVTKGTGDIFVQVEPGVDTDVRVNLEEGEVILVQRDEGNAWRERVLDPRPDGNYRWVVDAEREKATRTVEIAQSSGTVRIQVMERKR